MAPHPWWYFQCLLAYFITDPGVVAELATSLFTQTSHVPQDFTYSDTLDTLKAWVSPDTALACARHLAAQQSWGTS